MFCEIFHEICEITEILRYSKFLPRFCDISRYIVKKKSYKYKSVWHPFLGRSNLCSKSKREVIKQVLMCKEMFLEQKLMLNTFEMVGTLKIFNEISCLKNLSGIPFLDDLFFAVKVK